MIKNEAPPASSGVFQRKEKERDPILIQRRNCANAGTLPELSSESAPQFCRANKYTQPFRVYRFHWKNRFCMRRVEKELAAAAMEQHTKICQYFLLVPGKSLISLLFFYIEVKRAFLGAVLFFYPLLCSEYTVGASICFLIGRKISAENLITCHQLIKQFKMGVYPFSLISKCMPLKVRKYKEIRMNKID